jgi:hypothetical protein
VTNLTAPRPLAVDADGSERRALDLAANGLRLEVRDASDDGAIPFEGYAARFGTRSQDLGGFFETIAPGAFAGSLAEDDIRFTINHDPSQVLARRRGDAGDTLRVAEDGTGLFVQARMGPTTYARDLAIAVQRGDISQMSFRFRTIKDSWRPLPDGMLERTLLQVQLRDVSVVTYPAYLDTDAAIRTHGLDELARALGLDSLDDARRREALAVLARGGEPADVLTAVRAITHPAAPPAATPIRDAVRRRMTALRAFHRIAPGGLT